MKKDWPWWVAPLFLTIALIAMFIGWIATIGK